MKTKTICNDCSIKFENKTDLVEHMKEHKESKAKKYNEGIKKDLPFDCNFCDRRFTSRCRLKSHIKIHNTLEESQEDERDKSFIQEEENNREVQCVICDKTFNDQRGLKIHTGRMHAPSSSMTCEICDFKCNTRSGVRKHMLEVHSLKRPISEINGFRNCDECGFKSKSKHAFEVHLEERHLEAPRGKA